LAACGGPSVGASGEDVGAPCAADNQCAQRCLQDNDHYPGGMCTYYCVTDQDCPEASACVGGDSGFCAVTCLSNEDCGDFGRGFLCDAVDRHNAPGGVLICRVP